MSTLLDKTRIVNTKGKLEICMSTQIVTHWAFEHLYNNSNNKVGLLAVEMFLLAVISDWVYKALNLISANR